MQANKILRIAWNCLLVLTLMVGMAGCGIFNIARGPEPLPAVSPLPLPELPDWIEEISPTGEAEPLNQIRIRFKHPLIPVESLGSDGQRSLLQSFEIMPPLPGRFRFLTPRMVGFQADKALPLATRIRVTLKAGLADLENHRLDRDLAWTFHTEEIQLTNLPGKTLATERRYRDRDEPIDLKPTLEFTSNVELNLDSLKDRIQLTPQGSEKQVPLAVALAEDLSSEDNRPRSEFDPSTRNWIYTIAPRKPLDKATDYRLEFTPGILPARGNLPSEMPFSSQLETYSPLKFEGIEFVGQPDAGGTYGRFVKGNPQLKFNNGLVADSAIENITVTPGPKVSPQLVRAYENSQFVNLNPWALEPTTSYTITVGKNLQDRYGQTLDKPVTIKYETGDVAPELWAPAGLNIFPAGTNLQLNFSTVNLPDKQYQAAYRVVKPTDLVYADSAYPTGEGNDLLPAVNAWQSFPVSGQKNQNTEAIVPLRDKLNGDSGMLAYGVQAKTNSYQMDDRQQWRYPSYYGMVQLTNLGVFAQFFPESGLIRVNHLSDGSPVANSPVEIYQSQLYAKSRPQPQACARGTTDATGTLLLNSQDLRQCMKGDRFLEPPELLVIARENQDWAFTRIRRYSGAYGYGIYPEWDNGKPRSRGVIFSDRQLYKPGEKAAFTGVAYYLENGNLQQDKNARYAVILRGPDGKKTDLGTQITNEFGTFSLELPLDQSQALGNYYLTAQGTSGIQISGEFRVAEFKPPNFKVELQLDKEFAFMKDEIEARAQSNYLFGAPVEGGKAQYYVTRQPKDFVPQGWEEFDFGPQWFWPEETPSVSSDVLQRIALLDDNGKGRQVFQVDKDLPYPMEYRVDVEVTDVSNLSVADSRSFVALPGDRLIGLRSKFVGEADKPFPVEVIVTDPTGKPIKGQRVKVELQRMKYSRVTRLVEGSQQQQNQVEYETVATADVRSGNSPQTVELTPTESGSYRIRANFARSKNESTATDRQIWATGGSPVFWGLRDDDRLEIKLDKDSYQPGETATVLIQSPYEEGELYFAIIRDQPIYQRVTAVKGGAPEIQFQVTPEMLPNAAVEVVLMRQGKDLSQAELEKVEDLVKIGFAPFQVNLSDKYLQVEVTPTQEKTSPGGTQTVRLALKDAEGKATPGQLTVMAVNEAVLQLSGYRPPDLVETVYAQQPIATRFSDNRPEVELRMAASPLKKGWGYGGGRSSAGATRIRKNFQALAYYNGSVLTDSNGQATVTFNLPDDLTTWRVMAVATDGKMHFGNGEATFMTTKPLLTNPILPQFARKGDRFLGGLSITNNTGSKGTIEIIGLPSGNLEFIDKNRLQTQIDKGTRAYRFLMQATDIGESKVQLSTRLNQTADAFEVPLVVKQQEVTEQVVESGTTKDKIQMTVNVDNKVVPDAGGLNISLASTLIPEIIAPARQVLEEDSLPFLEPAASQLAIASSLQQLGKKYSSAFTEFNPQQQGMRSIEIFQKLSLLDGGFAAWPGQKKSDPFITAYAAKSLAIARQAFPSIVDAGMLSQVKNYLEKILANPGQYDYCKSELCKNQLRLEASIALAELGDRQNKFLADIYRMRDEFDLVMQIKLARHLSRFSEWQQEAKAMSDALQQTIYETGRTAKVNMPQSWRWMSSPVTAQGQALRLFIARQGRPETLDRLLQGLLALRRDGTWGSSYSNAEALIALVDYSNLQPTPPNFTATVQLASKLLATSQFVGYRNASQELQVPMSELPRGNNDLILQKSGDGTLHYLVAYRYRLQGNQPGRFNGLRVTREIQAANSEEVLRQIGLFASDDPLELPPGQVYDIGLEIITDHPVDHVVITDPLPAGLEAVDTSFQTSTKAVQAQRDSWEIGYQTIYADRVVAYASRLDAGVYRLHYLARSVTPGTFRWPGAQAHLQYAPEEFGRSASTLLEVKE